MYCDTKLWALWQEAVDGEARAAANPIWQQSEEVQLIFSKDSSAAAETAWEMLKLILRHEIYAQLVEWQAEIMGVWKSKRASGQVSDFQDTASHT